jgi:hypothetical protein
MIYLDNVAGSFPKPESVFVGWMLLRAVSLLIRDPAAIAATAEPERNIKNTSENDTSSREHF